MVAMDPQSALLPSQSNPASQRDGSRARAGAPGRSPHPAFRHGVLARAVELAVIPRLLAVRPRPEAAVVSAGQVAELTDLTLLPAESAVLAFVGNLHDRGIAAEAIYLDLLTPAARRLGQFWVDDICDFTQVTVGLWKLQNAMRTLEPAFLAGTRPARQAVGRALLVPLPGEQHTFGLSMVQGFFRRAGWSVWSGPVASREALAAMVRSESVDVLGFSLACDERLDLVRTEIAAVRAASRNPGIAVMVGGPPFVADPALAAAVGADGTAIDGLQAVAEAGALLRRATGRRHASLRRGS